MADERIRCEKNRTLLSRGTRRARRPEDWILAENSASPRETLYSLFHGSALLLPSTSALSVFNGKRGQETISEFDSFGCQLQTLNS
jgi:hypothetical protein